MAIFFFFTREIAFNICSIKAWNKEIENLPFENLWI